MAWGLPQHRACPHQAARPAPPPHRRQSPGARQHQHQHQRPPVHRRCASHSHSLTAPCWHWRLQGAPTGALLVLWVLVVPVLLLALASGPLQWEWLVVQVAPGPAGPLLPAPLRCLVCWRWAGW